MIKQMDTPAFLDYFKITIPFKYNNRLSIEVIIYVIMQQMCHDEQGYPKVV